VHAPRKDLIMSKINVVAGCWDMKSSDPSQNGIAILSLDYTTGELTKLCGAYGPHAGTVCVSPNKKTIYVCNEQKNAVNGINGSGGSVLTYKFDRDSCQLHKVSELPSYGAFPAFICTDHTGKYVFVVNHGSYDVTTHYQCNADGSRTLKRTYDSGCVSMYSTDKDGVICSVSDIKILSGEGSGHHFETHPNAFKLRFPGLPIFSHLVGQGSPHPHSVNADSHGNVVVCDKGADRVIVYEIDYEKHNLVERQVFNTYLGCAPRHLAFHPALPFFYIVHEQESSISTYSFDRVRKTVTEIQTLGTLPTECNIKNAPADVRVHPNGQYVYASNRGHNSIAVYRINQSDGKIALKHIERIDAHPRGINITPNGAFLIAGDMTGNRILVFPIGSDGLLDLAHECRDIFSPTSISFL